MPVASNDLSATSIIEMMAAGNAKQALSLVKRAEEAAQSMAVSVAARAKLDAIDGLRAEAAEDRNAAAQVLEDAEAEAKRLTAGADTAISNRTRENHLRGQVLDTRSTALDERERGLDEREAEIAKDAAEVLQLLQRRAAPGG